ncbi:MAG: cation:proton antiporter [Bryobacterales bacterium]|jgi:CPA2 family monovalent cation:H+ antiporter-2|nr:cation:proton antiporter [Bryobacterales bacterium]
MDQWKFLAEIVLLLGVAMVFGIVAQRLRQNAVIGYLIAGIALGPRTFGFVKDAENVEVLAELGVALLLFTIGLEFSWRRLKQFGKSAALMGVFQIGVSILVGLLLTSLAGFSLGASFVWGATLAMSSTAVVLRILIERAELDSPPGRNALSILLMQDLAVVPLLIMVSVLADGQSGARAAMEIGMSFLRAGGLILGFFVAIRFVLPRLIDAAASAGNRDLPVVLAIAVSLGCSWAAHAVGLSPVLGAFAAGILLADLDFAEQIRADVMPLRAAFVTLFFTSIGMLAAVPSLMELLVSMVVAIVLILLKAAIITAILLALRQPLPFAIQTGLILGQIGEFSFVLARIAVTKNLLPQEAFDQFLGASVVTLLATPYLIQYATPVSHWISNKVLAKDRRKRAVELQQQRAESKLKKGRVIVVGYGPAGRAVANALKEEEIPYFILETNPKTVSSCRVEQPIEIGDATQPEILEHAGIVHAAAVVVSIPDPGISRTIVSQSRMLAPEVPILVRARYSLFSNTLETAGASTVVDEEWVVGEMLARRTLDAVRERRPGLEQAD